MLLAVVFSGSEVFAPLQGAFSFQFMQQKSDLQVVGLVESFSYGESEPFSDLTQSRDWVWYRARIVPIHCLKGRVKTFGELVERKDRASLVKDLASMTVEVFFRMPSVWRSFGSPTPLFPIHPGKVYLFSMRARSENRGSGDRASGPYDLTDQRYGAIPVSAQPTEGLDKGISLVGLLVQTMRDQRADDLQHRQLYEILMKSDLAREEKPKLVRADKAYWAERNHHPSQIDLEKHAPRRRGRERAPRDSGNRIDDY